MSDGIRIVEVTVDNVDDHGFFCKKSKRRSEGWLAKRAWFDPAAGSGVRTWLATDGKRQVGFVEAAPGPATWRAVDAPDHWVVHCLWVVGRAKQQGTGGRLLQRVMDVAKADGRGVAVLTSSKKGWLLDAKLPAKLGFAKVGEAPPCFELWAVTPDGVRAPTLPTDWEARAAAFGDGLTLIVTHQCPYVDALRETYRGLAERRGLVFREVLLTDAADVRARSPAAYGVVSVVLDGRLLAWRWETDKVLDKRLLSG